MDVSSVMKPGLHTLVIALILPVLAGCLAGSSMPFDTRADTTGHALQSRVPDAGWFILALGIDDQVSAARINATVTLHRDDGSQQQADGVSWGCAYWGAQPDPLRGLPHARIRCIAYTPDGRAEVGAYASGQGTAVSAEDPLCCHGMPSSDTFRLSDFVDRPSLQDLRDKNRSVAYFVVYGGGPRYRGMTYEVSVTSEARASWTAGQGDEGFTYQREAFSSMAWMQADVLGSGYYVQRDGELTVDPDPNRSELVAFWPTDVPDYESDEYEGSVRLPSGHTDDVRFAWWGASFMDGPWTFHLNQSMGESADFPVVMGTPIVWISPNDGGGVPLGPSS